MIEKGDIIRLKADLTIEELVDRMVVFPRLIELINKHCEVLKRIPDTPQVVLEEGRFPSNMFEIVEKGKYEGILLTTNEHALLNILPKRFVDLEKEEEGFFLRKEDGSWYHSFRAFEGVTFFNLEKGKCYNIEKLKLSPTKLPF